MKILVAGDLLPQECNEKMFEEGDVKSLFGTEILKVFNSADLRLANLEGPLTSGKVSISKSGPALKASVKSIAGIKALKIDCLSLANNHILDYGDKGLEETIRILYEAGIWHVGAGMHISDARKPIVMERNGWRIGIYSCAEYEFTIADESHAGANPFDALEIADDISELREKSDYVICLYHGGKELYRYPVPYVQRRCRKIIGKGADLVLCQHSHCVACKEEFGNGTILYGQGNFCFNRTDDAYRRTGLLVEINLQHGSRAIINYLPVVRNKEKMRMADSAENAEIIKAFQDRSQQIMSDRFVENSYEEFVAHMFPAYYELAMGIWGKLLKRCHLNKTIKRFYRRKDKLDLLNAIRDEAHRDILIKGLELELAKGK